MKSAAACKRLTTVVYLEAPAGGRGTLIARYLSDPKPVLWGDQFVAASRANPRRTPSRAAIRS